MSVAKYKNRTTGEWEELMNGIDGKTPVKGKDYFTEADKAEIVSDVIAALPKYMSIPEHRQTCYPEHQ